MLVLTLQKPNLLPGTGWASSYRKSFYSGKFQFPQMEACPEGRTGAGPGTRGVGSWLRPPGVQPAKAAGEQGLEKSP